MNHPEDPQLAPLETTSLADLRRIVRTSQSAIERHAAAQEEASRYRDSCDYSCRGNEQHARRLLRGAL